MIGLVFKYFDLAVSAYPNNKRSHFILNLWINVDCLYLECADCIFTFLRNGGFSVLVLVVSKNILLKSIVEVQVE